jgi:TetR/AcrR family transcriptional repressor of nem operon
MGSGVATATSREKTSREKILEAAATLFHRFGFNGTSLDDILGSSGVCRSNFYYHFRSKEDLALQVLREQARTFEAWGLKGVLEDSTLPARERLLRLCDLVAERQRADGYRCGCPFGNLAAELGGMHPEFRRRLSEIFSRWERSVERCLQEGVARGEFRADLEPRLAATALISQIEGAILLMKTYGHGRPLEAGVRSMLKFLEGG